MAAWTANVVLLAITLAGFFAADVGYDWLIFVEAGQRVMEGGLYDWDRQYAWSYSPLLAFAFAAIAPIGYWGWSILHILALGALRDRWLIVIALLSWPFWADVYNGNTVTFVFVVAAGAVRGSAVATGSFLLMSLLMPRPLMLPVLAWILWRQPAWRVPFALLVGLNAAAVVATGYGTDWIRTLTGVTDAVAATSRDIGPAALIGGWWTIIGGIAAVILLIRQRIGFASLAASPYWLPQYFLMLLLELVPRSSNSRSRSPSGGQTPIE